MTINTTGNQTVELSNAEKDFLNDTLATRNEGEEIYFCNNDSWCANDSFVGTRNEAAAMLKATGWENQTHWDENEGAEVNDYENFDGLLAAFIADCGIITAIDGVELS